MNEPKRDLTHGEMWAAAQPVSPGPRTVVIECPYYSMQVIVGNIGWLRDYCDDGLTLIFKSYGGELSIAPHAKITFDLQNEDRGKRVIITPLPEFDFDAPGLLTFKLVELLGIALSNLFGAKPAPLFDEKAQRSRFMVGDRLIWRKKEGITGQQLSKVIRIVERGIVTELVKGSPHTSLVEWCHCHEYTIVGRD